MTACSGGVDLGPTQPFEEPHGREILERGVAHRREETSPWEFESAYLVSLVFCVLDNNIRNFKCVLSGADFIAQELAMSLSLF
jgi:hypothetical protein